MDDSKTPFGVDGKLWSRLQEITWLSPADAARALGTTRDSVGMQIAKGKIRALRSVPGPDGKHVALIPASEVEHYRRTRKPRGPQAQRRRPQSEEVRNEHESTGGDPPGDGGGAGASSGERE